VTKPARYISPLRYPGGKATMAQWLGDTFAAQQSAMDIEIWVEPFAGAALTLLDRKAVDEVWLIDQNQGLAAFWSAVVDDGAALAQRVEATEPTLDLYKRSRDIISAPETADPFELAYATFIINRCSRSGIVAPTSGPMGGREQAGEWTIGSRFNAVALADRIRHVASFSSRMRVFHGDGIGYIEGAQDSGIGDEMVLFVDPPYIREGNRLYANGMDEAGHQRLADALNGTDARWVLTYDDEPVIHDVLYPRRRVVPYDIRNTANRARVAREFAVFSDNFVLDKLPPGAHLSADCALPISDSALGAVHQPAGSICRA
jgi:DNA adenine methylase